MSFDRDAPASNFPAEAANELRSLANRMLETPEALSTAVSIPRSECDFVDRAPLRPL